MDPIINVFFPSMRNMASDILVLSFTYWPLTIPFVAFGIREIIKLFKKLI